MLKRIVSSVLSTEVGLKFVRFLTQNHPKIFMYHNFSEEPEAGKTSAELFEQQIQLVKNQYDAYTLQGLIEYKRKHSRFPKNAVVITIDDGYKSVYDVAFPILKKYGIPATFYVATDFIDNKTWLWPDKIKWMLSQLSSEELSKKKCFDSIPLNFTELNAHCLELENDEKFEFIKSLSDFLDLTIPKTAPGAFKQCSWQELAEMQQNGIEIGGHSVSHPCLSKVDSEELLFEVVECYSRINQHLGNEERTFCFPNGQPDDYNNEVKKIIEKAGYSACVTAFSDAHRLHISFAWRRYCSDSDFWSFKKNVAGMEMLEQVLTNNVRCDY